MTLRVVPITLKAAAAFIEQHHRHHGPPRGWRFGAAIVDETGTIRGVGTAGRPVARRLDDALSLEINRTCTDGVPNGNSLLYGALWRAGRALGYVRAYTYTQGDESGASLRAAGWVIDAELAARGTWADHSVSLAHVRDQESTAGGVTRTRWRVGAPR